MSIKFKQEMTTAVWRIFRLHGMSPSVNQQDEINGAVSKLASLIENQAKQEAIELIRKIQDAILAGFKNVDKDVAALAKRVEALEEKKPATKKGPGPYEAGAKRPR